MVLSKEQRERIAIARADRIKREQDQRRTIDNTIDVNIGGVGDIASAISELTESVRELTKATQDSQCKCDSCKTTYTGGY